MSTRPPSGVRDDIAGGSSGWSGPNERTASVDAALVRVVRALDSTALHHEGKRPRRLEMFIESAADSVLEFEIGTDGRWLFDEGSWVDGGRLRRSRLLRPVIRGVARATRPDFDAALDALVRDIEVACAARISIDSENDPSTPPTPDQGIDQLLAMLFPGWSETDRASLRAVGEPVELGAGTIMFVEGETGESMLFLLGGTIAVETRSGVVRLGAGSVVGERSPLTGKPRDATVHAITDVLGLTLTAGDLALVSPAVVEALNSKVDA